MRELRGRVAVVTGGGSGIGRGMALALADAGMHVAIADLEPAAAETVAEEVRARGVRALAVPTDVARRESVEDLAETVFRDLGGAHVICNNAGVSVFGPLTEASDADWRWVLSVNLEGVVHGVQAFLPRLRRQAEGGHFVNTASMAGHSTYPMLGVYCTTKFAVVGLSEAMHLELAPLGIGVTVLCPGVVKTRIVEAARNRPAALGGPQGPPPGAGALMTTGRDPLDVGRRVREAVEADELYVFTHPEMQPFVEGRFEKIRAAFDRAAARERSGRDSA